MKKQWLNLTLCATIVLSSCGGGAKEDKKEASEKDKPTEKTTEKSTSEPKEKGEEEKNTEEVQQEKAVVIAKSGLSLREEPNGKSKLIKLLPTNTIVNVLEKGADATINGKKSAWYKVLYGGKYEGYAFGGYLKMGTKLTATTDANVETAGDGKGETTSFSDVLQKGLITAPSGLTLRKTPSAKGASITVIPMNQEVGILEFAEESSEVDGVLGGWCKVRYGKKEGYLFSHFINFSIATISAKSGLTLRERGSKDSPKITVIPSGKTVYLLPPVFNDAGEMLDDSFYQDEDGSTWYKVRYGKFEGWASGQYLEMEQGC